MAKKKKTKKATRKTKPDFAQGVIYMDKDPRAYEAKLPAKLPHEMRIVGVDLGSHCGISFCDMDTRDGHLEQEMCMGQWDLGLGDYDTGPLRFIRMKQYLGMLQPDLVMFEDVKYTPPKAQVGGSKFSISMIVARVAKASELIGGMKIILTTWCEQRGIPAHGIPISHIKRFATGKGNANKEDMINAANKQFGTNLDPDTYMSTGADNMADSAFLCNMGLVLYSEGLSAS